MRISIARTFSGRFSSGLTSSGLISPKRTSPKQSSWTQFSVEQTSQQRGSPRKSWNRQPETRTPDSLLILIPPCTGESRLTNRLGRIELQRGRGSTEVLRGRKGILRNRGCEPGRLMGTGPGLYELRHDGVLGSWPFLQSPSSGMLATAATRRPRDPRGCAGLQGAALA